MKNSSFKKLMHFSLGPILGALISLITVPLTTHFLSPEELGRSSVFIIVQSLIPIMYLGLDQSFTREYHIEKDKKRLLLTTISLPMILAILFFIFSLFQGRFFSYLLFGSRNYNLTIYLLGFSAVTSVLEHFILLNVRMREKALEYSLFHILSKGMILIFTTLYVIFIRNDFLAIVYATVIGQTVVRVILYIRYKKIFSFESFRVNFELTKRVLLFGLPLFISVILSNFLKTINTFILRFVGDFEQLGFFATATRIAALFMIVQTAFTSFWVPTAYRWHEEKKEMKYFQEVSEIVLFCVSIGFILLLFMRPLISVLVSEDFEYAIYLISFLSFVPIMYTVTETTRLGVTFSRKSYLSIIVNLVSLSTNFLLSVFLIPKFGAMGAAISIAISYVMYFFTFTFLSFLKWEPFSVKKHFVIVFLMLMLSFLDLFSFEYEFHIKVIFLILFVGLQYKVIGIGIGYLQK